MFVRSACFRGAWLLGALFPASGFLIPAHLTAQKIATTQLCNTGRTPKSAPPDACLSTTLVSPINPYVGGPIKDGNWKLATPYPSAPYTDNAPTPCSADFHYEPAPVNKPSTAWYNPADGKSQWISPDGGGTTPPGWYIYATSFIVPGPYEGYENYGFKIIGQFMADDQVSYIYVSDTTGGQIKCGAVAAFASNGFGSWTPFEAEALVLPDSAGYVYFIVYNATGSPTGNPTGLRVEFQSTYFTPY